MCNCGASVVQQSPVYTQQTVTNNISIEDCEYSMDQLRGWLDKLICCKDKGLYITLGISGPLMNKYLGDVMSALNYPTNPCYFKNSLDIIGDVIILINNSNLC
jgi:hypothetical protein